MLAGRDLLGAAQTGTGKTAGFTLPMLQRLSDKANASHSPARHPVRALIITPTRELAAQVEESVRNYGKYVGGLKSALVYGGVGMQPQVDALRRGVDILVATPGRLLDHVEQKTADLRYVEILVLDEADRMLDMGFIHDIRKILALLPQERQNLLFSATFPEEIRKLSGSFMKDPVTVEVARRNTPIELVAQVAHPVDGGRKRELLAHLVKSNDWKQVLVFVKTKHGANRLAQQLERAGVEADAIHGNKSQNARTKALSQFKEGSLRVLVATDIAARGLDIEALPHVVNFDLPHVAEDYIHRIGRTGRAGAEGEAVSLIGHEDRPLLAAIERLMNRKVEQRVIAGFEPGTASSEPHQPEPGRQHQQRRPQQQNQRRGGQQQQPRRDGQQPRRDGQQQQPRHDGQPQQRRDGQPQQRRDGQQPRRDGQQPRRDGQQQYPRGNQQPRPQQHRPVESQDSAYEDQIREARARMREEGESVPPPQPQQQQPRRNDGRRPQGARADGRRPQGGGQGRGGNGGQRGQQRRPGAGARSSRNQQWDPRRTEAAYREPADHSYQQPTPSHAVKVTHKPKRTLSGFVGALLGRKTEESKND